MINVIVELSKYTILTLMIVYTFHCFYTVRQPDEEERNELLRQQLILIFFIDFTAFLVIYLKTFDYKVVRFYIEMQIFFAVIQILYRVLYKKASLLLLNNMCMLLSVGFIMLCRLDITMATKQLLVAAGASAVALAIPVMIRKMRFLRKLTWIYAGIGVVLLGAVFLLARTSYGAKLTLLGVQPSEAIKITFVFFMASFLSRDTSLKAVVQVSAVAAFHVGILVLSRDLGSAVIFFAAYLVMVYVYQKCRISGTWTCRRKRGSSGRLSSVWTCQTESQRMEGSDGSLPERGLPDRTVAVCDRNWRLVRHGTLPGLTGVHSGC